MKIQVKEKNKVIINGIFIIKILLDLVNIKPVIKKGIKMPYIDKKRIEMSNWEKGFLPYSGFNNISKKFILFEAKVILSKVKN